MPNQTPLPASIQEQVTTVFQSVFGKVPGILVHAPGRINLIGEHTDYNHGLVLPAAIPEGICFAMDVSDDRAHHWHALDISETYESASDQEMPYGDSWIDYLRGAYAVISDDSPQHGIRCVFASNLPAGAGLSSSSALTCGFLLGLNALLSINKSREELAWLGHVVERDLIGLQGGIMDQHASLLCRKDHLLLLDCLTRTFEQVEFTMDSSVHVFLINTNVRHKLTDTDYNTRAAECRQALAYFQSIYDIRTLRDVTGEMLTTHAQDLGPILEKRVGFVLRENERVLQAVNAVRSREWKALGTLLFASHAGLRDDYAVSCEELDFLVEMAISCDEILGARMMGGGFGGCTINLSSQPPSQSLRQRISAAYVGRFGYDCTFLDVTLSNGASVLAY